MRLRKFCVVLPLLAFIAAPALATILTFSGGMPASDNPVPQTYGDNVSGSPDGNGHLYNEGNGWTPNIQAAYAATAPSALNYFSGWDGGDALYMQDASINGDPWFYQITFTSDPGYGAQINSFDLNDWGTNVHTIDWTIFEDSVGGTVLDSGATGSFGGDLTITTAGLSYIGTSVLEIVHTGERNYLALDNLNFDQVPEPMTLSLLGLGGMTLIRRRRRV